MFKKIALGLLLSCSISQTCKFPFYKIVKLPYKEEIKVAKAFCKEEIKEYQIAILIKQILIDNKENLPPTIEIKRLISLVNGLIDEIEAHYYKYHSKRLDIIKQ